MLTSQPPGHVASQMTEADHLERVKAVALTCGWRLYHTFDSRRSAAGFPALVQAGLGTTRQPP